MTEMKIVAMIIKRFLVTLLLLFFLVGCVASDEQPGIPSGQSPNVHQPGQGSGSTSPDANSPGAQEEHDDGDMWRIIVIDTSGEELWSFTEGTLSRLSQEQAGAFSHVYSTINNWPTARFYVADGYSVLGILTAAGVHDVAQTVTFRSADGYEISLIREQLFSPQYFFPHVGESGDGAVQVLPIIAYRWRDGSDDMSEIREDKPTLIFGQRNPFEHTNPAFVVGVTEIVVDAAPSERWVSAGTFPMAGEIPVGETVKLQHPSFGLVKLHYTLDGSDPTPLSPMYNPSTFRPELNVPIPITGPTTIKVLVTGYGKVDSEIAVFEFRLAG